MRSIIRTLGVVALIGGTAASPLASDSKNGFISAYLDFERESVANGTSTSIVNLHKDNATNDTAIELANLGDRVPLWELPECYQKCIDHNCCKAMWIKDVRKLSTRQFCWTMRFSIERWMLDHLQYCVGPHCRPCRPECRIESTKWMKKYCHRG
ncbi:hypothetical protein F5Y19DRAFT_257262 [Xylariaceae sp. FL1651]|nr:hypothetical protein F5Y19DRAFT_257262 [Xylariaceae sp. FL1651]